MCALENPWPDSSGALLAPSGRTYLWRTEVLDRWTDDNCEDSNFGVGVRVREGLEEEVGV